MPDKIKVTATVMPVRVYQAGQATFLEVDVALNPHLPDTKMPSEVSISEPGIETNDGLAYYKEILKWYAYREVFRQPIDFRFYAFATNGDKKEGLFPNAILGLPVNCNDQAEDSKEPDPGILWNSMFTKKTIVSSWELDELPYDIAGKISSQELKDAIVHAIDECIDDLLVAESRDNDQNAAALALYLTELRNSADPINSLLNDPIIAQSADPRLNRYHDVLTNFTLRYRKELNEMALDLNLRDLQTRNMENTGEFHKRFSAYSAHPYLLRKTGWIWRYCIEITSIAGYLAAHKPYSTVSNDFSQLFISIGALTNDINYRTPLDKAEGNTPYALQLPFYLSFLAEVKFLYPLTAIRFFLDSNNIPTTAFVSSKKPGPGSTNDNFITLDEKFGYVKIKNGSVEGSAYILDRKQLMDKLDDQYKELKKNPQYSQKGSSTDAPSRELEDAIEKEKKLNAATTANGGGAEYNNNGITISIRQLAELVQTSRDNTPGTDINIINGNYLEGSGLIYLHNLLAGYRIDAVAVNLFERSSKLNPVHFNEAALYASSLCLRTEFFYDDYDKPKFCTKISSICGNENEGWVGVSAQGSNSNKIYIDPELTRWNNWSLVCMRLGDGRGYVSPPSDNSNKLFIEVVPPAGKIIPQRFGWIYTFALRPADICGGGPPPVTSLLHDTVSNLQNPPARSPTLKDELLKKLAGIPANEHVENSWTEPVVYQRIDPIASPVIIRGTRLYENDKLVKHGGSFNVKQRIRAEIERQKKEGKRPGAAEIEKPLRERLGEDVNTMVVRSIWTSEDGIQKLTPIDNNETIRFFGPPPASLDFVLQHGALDNLLAAKVADKSHQLDQLAKSVFDLADPKSEEKAAYYIDKDKEIDYLYDPLADGLEIHIDNKINRIPLNWSMFLESKDRNSTYPFQYLKKEYWNIGDSDSLGKHKYHAIALLTKEPDSEKFYQFNYNTANNRHELTLKPGLSVQMTVSCLEKPTPDLKEIDLFYPGIAKPRATTLKAIHAVQKPCLIENTYRDTGFRFMEKIGRATISIERPIGGTAAFLSMFYEIFPVLTSETYNLYIQSIDMVPDKTSTWGYRLVITDQKVLKANVHPDKEDSERNVEFRKIEHDFGSTIHRMVNYRIEAVSKFRKYFDSHPVTDKASPFSVFGILREDFADLKLISDETSAFDYNNFVKKHKWQIIQSTKCPDKPVVEKIVPLMEWKIDKSQGKTTVERRCNRFRIYLKDWYSSGANEQLAVFFIENNKDFSSRNALHFPSPPSKETQSLQGVISQFGTDPSTVDNAPVHLIDHSFFKDADSTGFLNSVPLGNLQFAKPYVEDPQAQADLANIRVQAALYEIKFINIKKLKSESPENANSITEGKYYVEVSVNANMLKDHYLPFLRFAIARYQEHSLNDPQNLSADKPVGFYNFSEVVLTDFVQPLPYRKLVIENGKILFFATPGRIGPMTTPNLADAPSPLIVSGNLPSSQLTNLFMVVKISQPGWPDIYETADRVNDPDNNRLQVVNTTRIASHETEVILSDPSGAFVMMEYEDYKVKKKITEYQTEDLRDDFTKRMVFSYTHKF